MITAKKNVGNDKKDKNEDKNSKNEDKKMEIKKKNNNIIDDSDVFEIDKKATSPYFTTKITCVIGLHPKQMGPKINSHLKENIIKKYQNKCFGSSGYISEIYNILSKDGGIIPHENALASAKYKIEFLCKFCRPLKNMTIVCEVIKINKAAVHLRNGPINVYVFENMGKMNEQNFKFDKLENVLKCRISSNDNRYVKVLKGTHINVKCDYVKIDDKTPKMTIWGSMERLSTDEEINDNNIMMESNNLKYVDYDEYIKTEEEYVDESEQNNNEGEEEH